MIDQLIIGDKASFDDFWASLARRKIGLPAKKTIKETVPFSNITYDFSAINGELYWEERELEYVFEITASTPEKLEELKTAFSSWVMNVQNEQIHDPFIPEHHFVGTYDDIDYEDEESLDKTTATVTFTAYPYKVANLPTVFLGASRDSGYIGEITVVNTSSHRVTATLSTEFENPRGSGTVWWRIVEDGSYTEQFQLLPDAETHIMLPPGVPLMLEFYGAPGVVGNYTFKVSYYEEVF